MFNTNIINRFKSIETPFYYYDLELLTKTVKSAFDCAHKRNYEIHYAIKANVNEPVLKIIQ
ncbi:MAG: diaminopimelate decarboxylase, partial [Sphingobacteriales bacterium]